MKRDDILRDACAELAKEEAEELERSLTMEERRRAESLYRRHKRKALSLIAQNSRRDKGRFTPWLRAAAVLLLLGGAVWWVLTHETPDPVHLSSSSTDFPVSSVQPTMNPSPSPSPVPPTATPTVAPTESPTETPKPTDTPTESPTEIPILTEKPDIIATKSPQASLTPEGWTGSYYPALLPEGYHLASLNQGEGRHTVIYAQENREVVFTEYDVIEMAEIPGEAKATYAQLADGSVALRLETGEGVTLIWQREGKTLSMYCEETDAGVMADSVQKISGR